jgi:hypothetical protein
MLIVSEHLETCDAPGGNGIASAGENFLIPVDIDEPSTVLLSVHGVKQSEVLAILRNEAPNAAHYLVLDTCRNTLQGTRGGKGFLPAHWVADRSDKVGHLQQAFRGQPGEHVRELRVLVKKRRLTSNLQVYACGTEGYAPPWCAAHDPRRVSRDSRRDHRSG